MAVVPLPLPTALLVTPAPVPAAATSANEPRSPTACRCGPSQSIYVNQLMRLTERPAGDD